MDDSKMELMCDIILNSDQFSTLLKKKVAKAVEEYLSEKFRGDYKSLINDENHQRTGSSNERAGYPDTVSKRRTPNRDDSSISFTANENTLLSNKWALSLCTLFAKAREEGLIKPLKPFVPSTKEADQSSYCLYHQARVHHTNDCEELKKEMGMLMYERKIFPPFKEPEKSKILESKRDVLKKDESEQEEEAIIAAERTQSLTNMSNSKTEKPHDEWGKSLGDLFVKARKNGLIKSLKPFVQLTRDADKSNMCFYHQERGHHTNDCEPLKIKMRRLISTGKIPNPSGGSPARQQT